MSTSDFAHDSAVERGVREGIALASKFTPSSMAHALATTPQQLVANATSLACATALLVLTCKEMEAAGLYPPGALADIQTKMGEVFKQVKEGKL